MNAMLTAVAVKRASLGLLANGALYIAGDWAGVEFDRGLAGWLGTIFRETVFLGVWRTPGEELDSSAWFLLTGGGNSGISRGLG